MQPKLKDKLISFAEFLNTDESKLAAKSQDISNSNKHETGAHGLLAATITENKSILTPRVFASSIWCHPSSKVDQEMMDLMFGSDSKETKIKK